MIALTGCGDRAGKLLPVQGKVDVDGRPLTAGEVRYLPEGRKDGTRLEPVGMIGSDGSYTMKTNGKDGVPAGKYKVTVIPPSAPAPSADLTAGAPAPGAAKEPPRLFNPKFQDVTESPLSVEVTPTASAGQYDLKLTR